VVYDQCTDWTMQGHRCRSASPLDGTSNSGADADEHADKPSNSILLLLPPLRRPSCAAIPPVPTPLCQGKAAAGWLRPIPTPARMTHIGPGRLSAGTPSSDHRRAPNEPWATAT